MPRKTTVPNYGGAPNARNRAVSVILFCVKSPYAVFNSSTLRSPVILHFKILMFWGLSKRLCMAFTNFHVKNVCILTSGFNLKTRCAKSMHRRTEFGLCYAIRQPVKLRIMQNFVHIIYLFVFSMRRSY